MSGGKFNDNGYVYYKVQQFADELQNLIDNNTVPDEYGYYPEYNEEVIHALREQVPQINRIARIMKAIDYLYSGDHGEDSFLREMKRVEDGDD
jgi:hypothetical protein